MKNGIAFIFKDDRVKFLKSYSFIKDYQIINYKINPLHINVNLTDNINDGCKWKEQYQVDSAYENLKNIIDINNKLKSIVRINSNEYKRFMKIKKLQKNIKIVA